MQVGKTLECGHCNPEKYAEGLALMEKAKPEYKCKCICHDNKQKMEEVIEEMLEDIIIDEDNSEHNVSYFKEAYKTRIMLVFASELQSLAREILEKEQDIPVEGEETWDTIFEMVTVEDIKQVCRERGIVIE